MILSPTWSLQAQSVLNNDFDVATHLKISAITQVQAPQIWNSQLIMTLQPKQRVKYAAVAFAHEGWKYQHLFQINRHGVYFLFYPLPAQDGPLEYRLIIDGVWTSDPTNPEHIKDERGLVLSRLDIPSLSSRRVTTPYTYKDGVVEFTYMGSAGQRVSLVGNFNNWDPFMTPLIEDPLNPGHFSIRIPMPSGPQYYNFVTGMETITDPTNPKIHWNNRGQAVSYFYHGQD